MCTHTYTYIYTYMSKLDPMHGCIKTYERYQDLSLICWAKRNLLHVREGPHSCIHSFAFHIFPIPALKTATCRLTLLFSRCKLGGASRSLPLFTPRKYSTFQRPCQCQNQVLPPFTVNPHFSSSFCYYNSCLWLAPPHTTSHSLSFVFHKLVSRKGTSRLNVHFSDVSWGGIMI